MPAFREWDHSKAGSFLQGTGAKMGKIALSLTLRLDRCARETTLHFRKEATP